MCHIISIQIHCSSSWRQIITRQNKISLKLYPTTMNACIFNGIIHLQIPWISIVLLIQNFMFQNRWHLLRREWQFVDNSNHPHERIREGELQLDKMQRWTDASQTDISTTQPLHITFGKIAEERWKDCKKTETSTTRLYLLIWPMASQKYDYLKKTGTITIPVGFLTWMG